MYAGRRKSYLGAQTLIAQSKFEQSFCGGFKEQIEKELAIA